MNCDALHLNYMNCVRAVWAILFICFGFFFGSHMLRLQQNISSGKCPWGNMEWSVRVKAAWGKCENLFFACFKEVH